jgi:cell division septation protein DedD
MTATESQTEAPPADAPVETPARVIPDALPLMPEDPPRVGEFWLRGRLGANAAGYLYAASDEDGRGAVVAMMTEGSADDAAARDRFVTAVDELPEDAVLAHNDADDDDLALWVAVGPIREDDGSSAASDERLIAERRGEEVLSAVLMDRIPHIGRFRGPDFRHYWEGRRRPGLFRIWPLPWPNALRPASRLALILALVTMAIIMALAVFLAWLLFRNAEPLEPEPVIPTPTGTVTVTVTPTTPPPTTPPPTTGPTPTITPSQSPTTGIPTTSPGSPGTSPGNPGDKF